MIVCIVSVSNVSNYGGNFLRKETSIIRSGANVIKLLLSEIYKFS
jgi:hypothetical protein